MELVPYIKETGRSLLDLFFPNLCLGCGHYIEDQHEVICENCDKKINYFDFSFCSECGTPSEHNLKCPNCESVDRLPVIALGEYIDPLREVIHQFKFQQIRRAAKSLGTRLIERHSERIRSFKPDVIIPVSLHSLDYKKRGFNQAADLAVALGTRMNLAVDSEAVEKTRRTREQVRLNAERRRKNLRGVFSADAEKVKSKRVIILDDVFTTGATIKEIAKVVKNCGGDPVGAVVAAATGRS